MEIYVINKLLNLKRLIYVTKFIYFPDYMRKNSQNHENINWFETNKRSNDKEEKPSF